MPPPCVVNIETVNYHQSESAEGFKRTRLSECLVSIAICLAVVERPSMSAERLQGPLICSEALVSAS